LALNNNHHINLADVQRWLSAYGASKESIVFAAIAGVVDGPSLLKLTTLSALKDWGVTSRITQQKILNALEVIREVRNDKEERSFPARGSSSNSSNSRDNSPGAEAMGIMKRLPHSAAFSMRSDISNGEESPFGAYDDDNEAEAATAEVDEEDHLHTKYKLIWKGYANRGFVRIPIPYSSTYQLVISCPALSQKLYSNVIPIESSGKHVTYIASLKPKIGRVRYIFLIVCIHVCIYRYMPSLALSLSTVHS
jgi:hypothetical protein